MLCYVLALVFEYQLPATSIQGIQLNPNQTHILLSTRFSEVSGRDNKMALPDLHYSDLLTPKSQHLWSTTLWPLQTLCVCLSLQMKITRRLFAVTVFVFFWNLRSKMPFTHAAGRWASLLQEMKGRENMEEEKLRECLKGENEWKNMQDNLRRFICNRSWEGTEIPGLGLPWANSKEHSFFPLADGVK